MNKEEDSLKRSLIRIVRFPYTFIITLVVSNRMYRAAKAREREDYETAVEHYSALIRRVGENGELRGRMARLHEENAYCLRKLGRKEEARAELKRSRIRS